MSLGKLDLKLSHINFAAEAAGDFLRIGRLEKQQDGFAQVDFGLFEGVSLACDVQLRTQGDEAVALPFENRGKCLDYDPVPVWEMAFLLSFKWADGERYQPS